MLCQQCHMREANVHYTQIINGNKVEMYLCSQCAEEKGKLTFSPQLSLGSLLWGFGLGGGADYPGIGQQTVLRCSVCGMSFDDFRRMGKLGCPNCYRVFRENLEPILRRLHGSAEHTGKVPAGLADEIKTSNEIERLKAELAAAVESEQYEKAAELRDRIRELENSGKNGGCGMMQDNVQPIQDMDIAISSRVRLARNLEAYPFSTRITRAQRAEILEKVKKAIFSDRDPDFSSGFTYYDMNAMKPLDRQLLVEKHLISPEFAEGQNERAAIISRDERVSILVNEEDHLRLQCIYPGMQLTEAWKRCDELDTRLDAKLGFAFDNVSGYLTCCPTNAGTGIRASVMLHLPALSMTGYIKNILETCSKIGVVVRGAYGENSEASGNMFQVSNQVTLGQTEEEIIAGISNITSQISNQERMLRKELYKQNPQRFEDRVFRSLGLLQNARIMSSEESQKLLSDVRLGVIMGLIRHVDLKKINDLMLMIQPAYLQKLAGAELRPDERDVRRAELLRKNLVPGGSL